MHAGSLPAQTPTTTPSREIPIPPGDPKIAPVRHELHFEIMRMVDRLEPYQPTEGLQGALAWHGSETMRELGQRISYRFRRFYPDVSVAIQTEGSEGGLALLKTQPDLLVGVSRMVKAPDAAALKEGQCKDPAMLIVGFEAIGIFVHKDNPLASVTQEDLQALFAASEDGKPKAKVWGDLKITGAYADRPIAAYERDASSGTQSFLLEMLEEGTRIATAHRTCANNYEVVSSIAKDPNGIGIADMLDLRPDVRLVPLVVNGELLEPTEENVLRGRYPLMRPLTIVFDKANTDTNASVREAILRFLVSRDGQIAVMNSGFYPLDPAFIQQQLNTLFGSQLR